MNARVVMADVVYAVDYVRERGRARHRDVVLEVVPVSIPELHADDAPVAMEARTPNPVFAWRETWQPIRAIGGALAMKAADREGRTLETADLQRAEGPAGLWTGSPYPFGPPMLMQYAWIRADDLRIRQVVSSGRDKALREAREQAARCAVIDDVLWVPAGQFEWDVMRSNGEFRIRGCHRLTETPTATPIAAGDRDAAVAHVAWLRTRDPRYAKYGRPIVEDNLRILEPAALPDASMTLARAAIDFQLRCWTDKGFAHIPTEAMEGWIAYRRAAAPVIAGEAGAVPGAFGALRGLLREVMRSDLGFESGETTMGNWARTLPEAIAWYDGYLSRLAPTLVQDIQSQTGPRP